MPIMRMMASAFEDGLTPGLRWKSKASGSSGSGLAMWTLMPWFSGEASTVRVRSCVERAPIAP